MEMESSKITETYIKLLQDTLDRKLLVIRELLELSQQQSDCLKKESFDEEQFDELMNQKEILLEELNQLDSGFERAFELVRKEVTDHKNLYKNEIIALQGTIRTITDISVNIQAIENRNKDAMIVVLSNKRKEIKNSKVQNQAVTNYYKTMANQHEMQSFFYDKKK